MAATKVARPRVKPRVKPRVRFDNLAELLKALGDIPPERIGFDPPPGTATEKDALRWLHAADKRLYELVNGTLVEKDVSAIAAYVAGTLIELLKVFLRHNGKTGMVLGADGTLRLMPGLLRIPDVSYTPWDRLPGRVVPAEPIPALVPDLAVEALSPGNTKAEMARKLADYFGSGVRLVWLIDPYSRTVRVYTSRTDVAELSEVDELTGGDVLPGFRTPVKELFVDLPEAAPPKPKRRKKGK